MTTITCQREGCGATVEAKSNGQRYCAPCGAIIHKERHRINVAKHQVRRAQTAKEFGFSSKLMERYTVRSRKQVAEIMGVTEECIRVTEISAMNKIRRALAKYV